MVVQTLSDWKGDDDIDNECLLFLNIPFSERDRDDDDAGRPKTFAKQRKKKNE